MYSIPALRTPACLMAAIAAMLIPLQTLPAQTRVDLRTQAKSADLSALGATRPVQTGTTLPATCAVGALFFRLDTVPGQNLYGCTATNIWSKLFQSSSDTFLAAFSDQTVLLLSKSTHGLESANIGVDCYNTLYSSVQPASVSVNSTTLDVQITFSAPTSGRCFLTAADRSSSGSASVAVDAGPGLVISESNGVKTLSIDTAVVPAMMTGSQILAVSSLQPGVCFEGSMGVPGAAVGDGVAPGWPPQIPASITGLMWIRTPGAVAVRLCNSGTAASPAFTETFRSTLVRNF